MTSKLFQNALVKRVENALETGSAPTHASLSAKAEELLFNQEKLSKMKLPENANNAALIDSCYSPIVQSGKIFDLKPSAASDDSKLDAGVIILQMGVRYASYCANVARTLFIDPIDVSFLFFFLFFFSSIIILET